MRREGQMGASYTPNFYAYRSKSSCPISKRGEVRRQSTDGPSNRGGCLMEHHIPLTLMILTGFMDHLAGVRSKCAADRGAEARTKDLYINHPCDVPPGLAGVWERGMSVTSGSTGSSAHILSSSPRVACVVPLMSYMRFPIYHTNLLRYR